MVDTKEQTVFRTLFDARAEAWSQNGSAWLVESRRNAIERFEELGLPDPRHEEWKYTNVSKLKQKAFVSPTSSAQLSDAEVEACQFEGVDSIQLAFRDGRLVSEQSNVGELPSGVTVSSLRDAIASGNPVVQEKLSSCLDDYKDHPFAQLNAALFEDGVFVHVPKGVALDRPVHAIFLSGEADRIGASFPRLLIVVEDSAQATIIEDHGSLVDAEHLSNTLVEVSLGDNARLTHHRLIRHADQASHFSAIASEQGRASWYKTNAFNFGGQLIRNDINSQLLGEDCECTLNGLLIGAGKQHIDNHTRIVHAVPHCRSWEVYKTILGDESTGVFNGKIFVDQIAQKTDAKQTNQSLLLSDKATINSKPELEIYADDVKCTHGATIGHLDENALFYLKSRGIGAEEGRRMLTYAFASEVADDIEIDSLKSKVKDLLYEKLPQDLTGKR